MKKSKVYKCLLPFLIFGISAYLIELPYFYPYTRWLTTVILPLPSEQSLPNPVPPQRFVDTWGAARLGGRKHEGVDIFAKRGTPIYSTTDGVVTSIGVNSLGGNFVGVLYGRTWHYYAHLEKFSDIKTHQWINAGTLIGYVGDNGNAKGTPPHLHYGIYIATGAVNPYPLIKQTTK